MGTKVIVWIVDERVTAWIVATNTNHVAELETAVAVLLNKICCDYS